LTKFLNMTKSQSPSARTNPALRALNTKSKMSKTVPNRHSNRTKWRKWLQTPDMNAEDDICKTTERVATTPYSPNWPGHLTEHLIRTKRCKNEKCKCKQKSNRAFECWHCGTEFPTTKAAKCKYFSKNNPAPEGAIKKRRKKNADKRVNASFSPPVKSAIKRRVVLKKAVNSAIKRRVVRKKPSMTKNDKITALMKEVARLKKKQRAGNMRRKLV